MNARALEERAARLQDLRLKAQAWRFDRWSSFRHHWPMHVFYLVRSIVDLGATVALIGVSIVVWVVYAA